MAMRLIDPTKPVRWVHPAEAGTEYPTTFHIIPLTEGQSRELAISNPTTLTQKGMDVSRDRIMRAMFLSNVTQIDNVFWPGDTTPSSITNRECIKRFYDSMPVEYAQPIYDAIQNTAVLEAGDAKNSGGSSESATSSGPDSTPADSTVATTTTPSDA